MTEIAPPPTVLSTVSPAMRSASPNLTGTLPGALLLRLAYWNDIRAWYAWCDSIGVHPLAAQHHLSCGSSVSSAIQRSTWSPAP
jgi:hypothetical protein